MSPAGVNHRDTNRRKEVEVKADNLSGVICGSLGGTCQEEKHYLARSGRVKSGLQIPDGVDPPLQNPKPLQRDPLRDRKQTALKTFQCKVVQLIFTLLDWGE